MLPVMNFPQHLPAHTLPEAITKTWGRFWWDPYSIWNTVYHQQAEFLAWQFAQRPSSSDNNFLNPQTLGAPICGQTQMPKIGSMIETYVFLMKYRPNIRVGTQMLPI